MESGKDAPIVRYHQYTGAFLTYPIARVYDHSALPVRITDASALVYTILLPPARIELNRHFDRPSVVEGPDGLALQIAHKDFVRVDGTEASK